MVKPEPAEKRGACRAEGSCVKASAGDDKVLGDGMETKADYVKQGDLPGNKGDGTIGPAGVRGFIVAEKQGNAC